MRSFTATGGREGKLDPKGRLVYVNNGGIFLVTPPIDGQPATHGNGTTIGFAVDGPNRRRRGRRPGSPLAAPRSRIRPGVRSGLGHEPLPRLSCAIRRATSSARFTGCPPTHDRDGQRSPQSMAGCRACIAMPPPRPRPTWSFRCSCPSMRRGEAAGAVVSVGADLHPRQRHRKGRISRGLRRAWG